MNVRLHIERLVLDEIPLEPHVLNQLRTAVESELARLIRVRGLRGSVREVMAIPALRGGTITETATDPNRFGEQIASAVYGSLR